jgi:hypothetical protein
LYELYERAIDHYRMFETERWIVPNSLPVLYFGDLARFRASGFRVVTVGLNPSNAEFETDRFGLTTLGSLTPHTLELSLSAYFHREPYTRWFDRAFETLLQPLGASFYGHQRHEPTPSWWTAQPNTALHTDLGTPLATNPTWSHLPEAVRQRLQATGLPLWRDLIQELEPHLVLISVAERHLAALGELGWQRFQPFPAAALQQELRVAWLGRAALVWGRPQVVPFFYLGNAERRLAALAILARTGLA